MHGLGENEANRLLSKLQETGIESQKIKQPDGSWALGVEREAALKAIRYLNESRLFRDGELQQEKPSLVSSREEQRFRLERALSRELEITLARLDGVLEARVHLNLPPVDPLFGQPLEKNQHGGGSALLAVSPGFSKKPEEIAQLIAGAAGLPAGSVTVMLDAGAGKTGGSGAEAAAQKTVASPVEVKTEDSTLTSDAFWKGISPAGMTALQIAGLLSLGGLILVGLRVMRRRNGEEVWESIDS